jgi:hypothetical protein
MTTLISNTTIPGEYYLGDYPGTLQYKVKPDAIVKAVKGLDITNGDLECGFVKIDLSNDPRSEELIRASQPDTATANANTWTPLLIMSKQIDDIVWLKTALRNNETNEIALMTSTNSYDTLIQTGGRGIHSHHPDWVIGHYRMVAPRIFWMELAKVIEGDL